MQSQAEESVKLGQVIWSKVLKSQSAYLSFRRTMRSSIKGAKAATFLLTDPFLPRSQFYCLTQMKHAAATLPCSEEICVKIDNLLQNTHGVAHSDDLNQSFSNYLNEIQLALISLHQQIADTWFQFRQEDVA